MIQIVVIIEQLPSEFERLVHGMLQANIKNLNGSEEEISISARVMEKLRELADEIAKEKGSKLKIYERYIKPESDRRIDEDRKSE